MARWGEDTIVRRALEAETGRGKIIPWIEECLAYAMPWRRKYGGHNRIDFDRLFDSTAPRALARFSGKIQAGMTPPFQRWFNLEAGPLVPKQLVPDVNKQLALPTEMIQAVLDASAFHTASLEAYADLAIGTGALLITEGGDDSIIEVESAAPWALGIERGPSGRIYNVFWPRTFKAWQLPRYWPKATWPASIRQMISDDQTQPIEILQASYFDPDTKGWRWAVMVRSGADRSVVWESENRANPWVVPRYWTTTGSDWGRGPLMLALADVKTINKTVEMVLQAAAYQLAPPLQVSHDGVVNPDTLRLSPRALIRVSRTGGPMGPSIAPLDIGSKVDLSQMVLEEMRSNVKAHLHDEQLPPMAGAVRSASEIIERSKDLAGDDSMSFNRLNHELAPPVVERVLDILDRKHVPGVNFTQMRPDFLTMKVKVISPMARAAALEDVQNTLQWAEAAATIGGPELFAHSAKIEDIVAYLGSKMGVAPELIRSAAERQAIEQVAGQAVGAAASAGQGGQPPPAAGGAASPMPFATPPAAPLQLPAPSQ